LPSCISTPSTGSAPSRSAASASKIGSALSNCALATSTDACPIFDIGAKIVDPAAAAASSNPFSASG
jgi:hypothetical protein